MTTNELLQQGINFFHTGNTQHAAQCFVQAILVDYNCAAAWLWLSGVVPTVEEQRYCLQFVLELNPDSFPAKSGLVKLGPGAARRPSAIADADTRSNAIVMPAPPPSLNGSNTFAKPITPQHRPDPVPITFQEVVALAYRLAPDDQARLIGLLAQALAERTK